MKVNTRKGKEKEDDLLIPRRNYQWAMMKKGKTGRTLKAENTLIQSHWSG